MGLTPGHTAGFRRANGVVCLPRVREEWAVHPDSGAWFFRRARTRLMTIPRFGRMTTVEVPVWSRWAPDPKGPDTNEPRRSRAYALLPPHTEEGKPA